MTKEELKQEAEEYADKYGKSNFDIWDTARFAYYQSAEPREKRIAELEKFIKTQNRKLLQNSKECNKAIDRVEVLNKENAELKCECRRCVYTDCPCVLSDYGKDRNGICDHFKDVFDEVVELKNKDCWKSCEYANPKAELIEQHIKDVQNLTKAKEKISKLLEVIKRPYQFTALRKIQLVNEAVQFLSEVEK